VLGWILLVPIVAVAYFYALKELTSGNGDIRIWLIVIVPPVLLSLFGLLLLAVVFLRWRGINVVLPRHVREHPEELDRAWIIDDAGFCLKVGGNQSASSWEDVSSWEISKDVILVLVDTGQSLDAIRSPAKLDRRQVSYHFPCRFFEESQLNEFIHFLKTRRSDASSTDIPEVLRAPTTVPLDAVRPAPDGVKPPVKEMHKDKD
jgi:hypothetical protein